MFWVSVLEIALFFVGLLLFFTFPEQMAFIFIHILHLIRGFVGLQLNRALPNSHGLVKEIAGCSAIEEESTISFEVFRDRVTHQMRTVFLSLIKQLESSLKLYFTLSIGSSILDFIEFII